MNRDPEPAAPTCRLIRNEAALIIEVDGAIGDVLGWKADDLVGRPSTAFIHPEDQPSAIAAWFDMISEPGALRTWRGRYQAGDGGWVWVETVNENRLDDPDLPIVVSSITRFTGEQVGVEEELRARKQVLSRLSDAIPVGIFQIDADRRITFTNDRFHSIIGLPAAATVQAQFAGLISADVDRLADSLSAVLGDVSVDGLEVHLRSSSAADDEVRVCQISLRPLTDHAGVVSGAIGCLSDVTDAARLRRELELRATVDSLTGCLNRAATLELLDMTLRDRANVGAGIAVVFVDLDGFKTVNDQYGHATGDAVLVLAAQRIQATTRERDHVGRIGGDEFLVLCPDVTHSDALDIVKRLHRSLHGALTVARHPIALGASLGLAWTEHETSADALIAEADEAMYAAKPKRRSLFVGGLSAR